MSLIFGFIIPLLLLRPAIASDIVYDETIVNASVANSANYTLDLSAQGNKIDYLSVQAIYSTGTISPTTFIDGVPSTGTISVLGMTVGSTITVNGIMFVEGKDFSRDISKTSGTATNLYTVLSTTPLLSGIVKFSLIPTASVIYATASIVGIDYTLSTSTPTAVAVAGMTGSIASTIDYTNNTISKSNNLITGVAVIFSTTVSRGGWMGLQSQTTYYAIATASTIQLATTKANAVAGTAIDISSITAKIGWATYTLTPSTMSTLASGHFGFKWQVSNDNTNWYNLSVTSITVTSTTNSSYFWDFGYTTYKYIRCALTAGDLGSIAIKLQGYGKKVAP